MASEKRTYLTVSNPVWGKMKNIGHRLDVSADPPGLYDARAMAINIWASPEDKPLTWEGIEISRGVFPQPRDYVGCIELDLEHPDTHECRLVLAGLEERRLDEEEWEWLEQKANELLALAEAELKPQEEEQDVGPTPE